MRLIGCLLILNLQLWSRVKKNKSPISNENFKRKLEDLKANGQLTTELEKKFNNGARKRHSKIKDDFAKQAEEKEKRIWILQLPTLEKNTQKERGIKCRVSRKETELKKNLQPGNVP